MSSLEPENRTAFTDALRPPPGYVLEAGIGTAFSLDFVAFTAVMLAFVGADFDGDRPDAPAVLTAVARLRTRLRVLVNAGGLHPPGRPNRLFALYDRLLHGVALGDAAFHPKVWVLSFLPQSRPELRGADKVFRVLCSSRNVTDSACWELGARFEGKLRKGSDFGRDLGKFTKRLAKQCSMPPSVHRLVSELPDVEFEGDIAGAEALRLHFQWPGEGRLEPLLPRRASRALFVSPFVRSDLLTTLAKRTDELILVSTQSELDALPDSAHELLAGASKYVVTGAGSSDVPALDLHAKALLWESGSTREMLLGSANATGAAWGLSTRANCEAMVALRPGLSIDGVLRSFVTPGKGECYGWIEEYQREKKEPDEAELAGRRLDALKRDFSQLRIKGRHSSAAATLTLNGIGSAPRELARLPNGVAASIAPLLRCDDAGAWQPLGGLFAGGLRFENVTYADLCAFAIVRLEDPLADQPRIFCIQFDLPMSGEEVAARDEAVHTQLLAAYDPRALLLSVLNGLPAAQGATTSRIGAHRSSEGHAGFLGLVSFERVMEACTSDPSKVDEVDALLSAYKNAEGMASFIAFWTDFKAVLAEEPRRG